MKPLSTSDKMMIIQTLDEKAHLDFSTWTKRWYVSARIEVGDGAVLKGITEHRDDPYEAVEAFLDRLMEVDQTSEEFLVTRPFGRRRHSQWNGAGFVDLPLPESVK